MKIALFTDVHLGINKDSNLKLNAIIKSIENMIDICEKKNVKEIFFLGDWFHNRNFININTLHTSTQIIRKLAQKFKTYWILGNHDLHLKNTNEIHSLCFLDLLKDIDAKFEKNIHVIQNTEELIRAQRNILCIPWLGKLNDISHNSYDLIIGHLELNMEFFISDFISSNNIKNIDVNLINSYLYDSELVNSEFTHIEKEKLDSLVKSKKSSETFLKSFFDLCNDNGYIFSGHFHKHEELEFKNKRFIFIGSLTEHTFADTNNEKGFYIVDLTKTKLKAEFIKNEYGIKHIKILYSSLQHDLKNLEELIDKKKANIIKIIIDTRETYEDLYSLPNKILTLPGVVDCKIEFTNSLFNSTLFETDNKELNSVKISKLDYLMKFIDIMPEKDLIDTNILKEKAKQYFNIAHSALYDEN